MKFRKDFANIFVSSDNRFSLFSTGKMCRMKKHKNICLLSAIYFQFGAAFHIIIAISASLFPSAGCMFCLKIEEEEKCFFYVIFMFSCFHSRNFMYASIERSRIGRSKNGIKTFINLTICISREIVVDTISIKYNFESSKKKISLNGQKCTRVELIPLRVSESSLH